MKKQTALKKATSVRLLAELLGISTQAVHKWPDTVPQTSEAKLRQLKPNWFSKTKGKENV